MSKQNDPYFKPIDDDAPMVIPESIEGGLEDSGPGTYEFLEKKTADKSSIKRIFIVFVALMLLMISWQAYSTFIEIMALNVWLGSAFGILVAILLGLFLKQVYIFRKGQQKIKTIERLRDQAETFVKERTHGKSKGFIQEFSAIYADKPQEKHLQQTLNELPDYLNDTEIISRLSDDFLCKLDAEAFRLVKHQSIATAAMVGLSQIPLVDSLIVLWKATKMVNQTHAIYGIGLSKIGQWRVLTKIVKATLFSIGSQHAVTAIVHKTGVGLSGNIVGNLAQGYAVGTFVANIGIETMKATRPIVFEEDELPSLNLISESIRLGLDKMSNDSNKPE